MPFEGHGGRYNLFHKFFAFTRRDSIIFRHAWASPTVEPITSVALAETMEQGSMFEFGIAFVHHAVVFVRLRFIPIGDPVLCRS